jgi:methylglutaconyl-CoA hydratase
MTARSTTPSIDVKINDRGRHAEVRISRPDAGNMLDQETILALTDAFDGLAGHSSLRAIILSSEGGTFCAGVDLPWMKAGAEADDGENRRTANMLAALFKRIHDSPFPTIAKIQGDAAGAGLGLVAACDIAIAGDGANFWTREVRTGILPALMSPYVIQAIGPRRAKYHFLTARPFSAPQALEFGLIHAVCPGGELSDAVALCLDDIMRGSPASIAATRKLVFSVAGRPIDDALVGETAACIAEFRAGNLARAGLACAIDGATPPWMEDHESERSY